MHAAEDYDSLSEETKAEYGILPGGMVESRVGRRVREKVVEACKNERIGIMFPARVVALGCIWVVLKERGMVCGEKASEGWVERAGGGKVAWEDWEDVIEELMRGEAAS